MIKLGFILIAIWIVGGVYFSWTAFSRWVFDPDHFHHGDLSRNASLRHRLFAAWFWPLFLVSKSGRTLLFYAFDDKKGIEDEE